MPARRAHRLLSRDRMEPLARRSPQRECSSGVRGAVDAVAMMASGRGDSQRVRRRLKLIAVAVDDDVEDVLVGLADRYEIRLRASVFATQREISEEKPDALILDEDDSEDAAYDLLDWLSRE